MSSVYWPRPERKRRSSLRFTLAPMPSKTAFIVLPPHRPALAEPTPSRSPGLCGRCGAPLGAARRFRLFRGGGLQLGAAAVHHVLRRGDRLDDVVVAGAAAEI